MDLQQIQQQSLKLTLTPQLKQAITMLQYNVHELSEYLYEQTLENPFVEMRTSKRKNKNRIRSFEAEGYSQDWASKKGLSLKEFLLNQLSEYDGDFYNKKIIEYLIMHLNQNGLLMDSLEQFSEELHVTIEEVENALKIIQTFEPIGVGARGAQECLVLQANVMFSEQSLVSIILSKHFPLLVNKKWKEIARCENVSIEEVQNAASLVLQLQPRPGSAFSDDEAMYITADVFVEKKDGEFIVKINDSSIPQLRWNKKYDELICNKLKPSEIQYVKELKLQFEWLEKSLQERKITIVAVMNAIIEKQREFFEKGPSFLKPCTLNEIAIEIGMHESTISRVSRSKYVQTPFGLFPIKYFFSTALKTSDGNETVSTKSVQILLKEIIETEDKNKPLSDQKLAEIMGKDFNITLARRTVAKYREELRIPSAAKRKV